MTTSLLTSANRSMKIRWPASLRTRNLASGMASARAAALAGGHVAVVGAVDHERRSGYVLNIAGDVEASPGSHLLV